MWSLGCILVEMKKGTPMFPALDENELLEMFVMVVGEPPLHMRNSGKKKNRFFDIKGNIIRSKNSRVKDAAERSLTIESLFVEDKDP